MYFILLSIVCALIFKSVKKFTVKQIKTLVSSIRYIKRVTLRSKKSNIYNNDLSEKCLNVCNSNIKQARHEEVLTVEDLYQQVKKDCLLLPNIEICFQISMTVTDCTGERSFPVLKELKNEAQR